MLACNDHATVATLNLIASLLIPVSGTELHFEGSLQRLIAYLRTLVAGRFEVILIPYGQSKFNMDTWVADLPEVRICRSRMGLPGKGAALRAGFDTSCGEQIGWVDSELPYDLTFFGEARDLLERGFDFVSGNRRLPQSLFTVPGSVLRLVYGRHRLGLMFNRVVRLFLGVRTRDTQAGVMLMTRGFAEVAFRLQRCSGLLFDLEIFLVAQENRFSQAELPVHLTLRREKRSATLIADALRSLSSLSRMFLWKHRGLYRIQPKPLQGFRLAPLSVRFFLRLRWGLTPYFEMVKHLPKTGKILDLACGHGLFSLAAAALRSKCQITGVDHDVERIRLAQRASDGIAHLSFQVGDLRDATQESYSGVAIIDALHYFTDEDQAAVLSRMHRILEPGGVLLVREVDQTEGARSVWNRLYERLAIRFRLTKTSGGSHRYRPPVEWARMLRALGFSVSWSRCSHAFFSDVLFVAIKEKRLKSNPTLATSAIPFRITADDWGLTPAVNRGILELARRGIVHRTSVLVDGPFVKEGLAELMRVPGFQFGLHFNLTYRTRFSSPGRLLLALLNPIQSANTRRWIDSEFDRQLEVFKTLGLAPAYFDGHHHVHVFPGVPEQIGVKARLAGFRNVRLPWDPLLWKTSKIPLWFFSGRAAPVFQEQGLQSRSCFYPQPKHFQDMEHFHRLLLERPESEVIVHPADENDFQAVGCLDSYQEERVQEYQSLHLLLVSFEGRWPESKPTLPPDLLSVT